MKRLALLAAMTALPAHAADPRLCLGLAQIVHHGASDGKDMRPIVDGVSAVLVGHEVSDDMQARILAAAYLQGYSQGLIGADAATVSAGFFSACMAEDA